jgi:hypothetical protein
MKPLLLVSAALRYETEVEALPTFTLLSLPTDKLSSSLKDNLKEMKSQLARTRLQWFDVSPFLAFTQQKSNSK